MKNLEMRGFMPDSERMRMQKSTTACPERSARRKAIVMWRAQQPQSRIKAIGRNANSRRYSRMVSFTPDRTKPITHKKEGGEVVGRRTRCH